MTLLKDSLPLILKSTIPDPFEHGTLLSQKFSLYPRHLPVDKAETQFVEELGGAWD